MSQHALVICAHSDDQVLGAGGTIAKLSDHGYAVTTLILSYGELSHPHLEEEYVRNMRREESERADDIVDGDGVQFLNLKDGDFKDKQHKARKHIKELLEQHNPDLVFTHSPDDFHQDHRATHSFVLNTYDDIKTIDTDIYVFDIWTLWNVEKRDWPRLYVGIDDTFTDKISALHEFSSQINIFSHTILNNYVYLKQYLTAFANGFATEDFFAEVFYKVR